MTTTAIWQEVEFGGYTADLPLWTELAAAADGPVLELGAGAGRVALHLADQGYEVMALERDLELASELERLARERGVSLSVVPGDLASPGDLQLPNRPALAIGPLHVIQVLEDGARQALLEGLVELLAPGGTVALALVDESTLLSAGAASDIYGRPKHRDRILPDMRELDGWVYSSEPLWVQVSERALTVRRLRERVSPDGQMDRNVHDEILYRVDADTLEHEASESGLHPSGRHQISSGESEADSVVVILGRPR